MVKHITGPGISKNDHVHVKTYRVATTDNIIDYIKPTIRQKRDIFIIHSGTNDSTKNINTMITVWKVVAAVKEIVTKGKIKLGFSCSFARSDTNKEEDISKTTGLKNIIKEIQVLFLKFFFIDNNNIDTTCLNKSKLHLNRKGTYYLANNFRKYIFKLNEIFTTVLIPRKPWNAYALLLGLG